ncbi:indolepyruvate oxidoreductase subunit beta [Selenomonadales bacterium OttesenSCG-928-I06]|nr:indolepyruvate oxidoreductase subunit beta [Selenomonadales bacterium OttesenSCG-928-I06]
MSKTKNILIVGVGGQGTLLASKILGQVALLSDLDVKQSEVHGMAQRGGSVITYVRLGEKISSPLIEKKEADIIIAFEKLEGIRWLDYLKEDGTIIINDQEIYPMPVIIGAADYPENIFEKLEKSSNKTIKVNGHELAKGLGETRALNVILLAVAAKLLPFEKEVWEKALVDMVPKKALEINQKAFELGWNL